MDLFLHAPALSPGSCAQRCHSVGRFGFDSFKVHHAGFTAVHPTEDVDEHSFCYCGPHYDDDDRAAAAALAAQAAALAL